MEHLDDEQVRLSKTRRKRAMEELQALGEALAALPADRLKKVDLPEELREAIGMAQRMSRQDEARRRQMQYIGRLMRNVEIEPIRAALADARGDSAAETARLHRLERLRNELLDDETALHEIAGLAISFGAATWPHQMVRIMLAEQLYRAATILGGHPYHRA